MPEATGDHPLPSHRAMRLAATPPTEVKLPPAYRLPSDDTASARTEVKMSWPDTPEPNADHSLPFHWAMELTGIAYVVNRRSACGDEIASYIQGVAGRRQRFNIPGPARR